MPSQPATQSMDLNRAECLCVDTNEGTEEAAGSLSRGLTLGDGADPHDAACLVEGSAPPATSCR